MNFKEYTKIRTYDYNEYCNYLLRKYKSASGNYFLPTLKRNKTIIRQGLHLHHIDENKSINLSNIVYAIQFPFDYQKCDRLVYADKLEHLFLHILIVEEDINPENTTQIIKQIIRKNSSNYQRLKRKYLETTKKKNYVNEICKTQRIRNFLLKSDTLYVGLLGMYKLCKVLENDTGIEDKEVLTSLIERAKKLFIEKHFCF